jgi:DNA invertase Pin-like site-specific DNA recombinase
MTVQDNVAHSYASGSNSNAAENNPIAILNWKLVREIRAKYRDGLRVSEIAEYYGLKYHTVSKVVMFKNWKEEV